MKTKATFNQLLLLLAIVCLLPACKKDKCLQTQTYNTYVPVYMSYTDLRKAVKSGPAEPLKMPGKIYITGNYLLVNEVNKGIHVIDNSNPSSPQNMAFISIPGNVDLATNGHTLYADSYTDLVCLDLSDMNNIKQINRLENALPYNYGTNYYYGTDTGKGVIIDWQLKPVTQQVGTDCGTGAPQQIYPMDDVFNANATTGVSTTTTTPTTNPNTAGVGGSTAKFTVANNVLYIVDNNNLHIYNVSNTSNPQKSGDQSVGWSIETIFPYKNHLFIGSSSGVYIYDISSPLSPVFVSEYNHITACDPVVVDDEYAYFTLSNDAPCHMGVNELEVVDITNLASPTLKVTVPMTNPKGVGIDAKTLFVCDSNDGLKVYDATDVTQIQNKLLAQFNNINAFDVIPYNKHLIMVGNGGVYQYDYSNVQNITLLSTIAVSK